MPSEGEGAIANNYTQFSFAVSLDTDEEKEWAERAVAHVNQWEQGDDPDVAGNEFDAVIPPDGYTFYDVEIDDDGLWFHADEAGDPDHVAQFVEEFLRRFRPDDHVGFSWADTCTKPRLDEFGGGAMVITAHGTEAMSVYQWLGEKFAELGKGEG